MDGGTLAVDNNATSFDPASSNTASGSKADISVSMSPFWRAA
jgi:hypothetical protein